MDDKIKVKDLATELGVNSKDLLRVLREMDVDAKNSASSVTMEEAVKAKTKMQPDAAAEAARAEAARKDAQPNVIVRRRRRTEEEQEESSADTASEAPAVAATTTDTAKADAKVSRHKADSASHETTPTTAPTPARVAQAAQPTQRAAKIITPTAATATAAEAATPKADDVQLDASVTKASADTVADAHSAKPEAKPVAKSKPEAMENAKPTSGDTSASESAQPVMPATDAAKADAPSARAEGKSAEQEASDRKRKRKAPVETPSARVIRRAEDPQAAPQVAEVPVVAAPVQAPQAANTAEPVHAAPLTEAKAGVSEKAVNTASVTVGEVSGEAKTVESADKTSDRPRRVPAASAMPEGSSQPSLLPPVSEARRPRDDNDHDGEQPRRRPQDAPTPQVRVISRPDPSQARVVERPAPTDYRARNDGRPSGPGGYRPSGPGGDRPSGPGGDRPSGPGGYRPSGPGGAPRPSGPGGPPRPSGPGGPRPSGPGGPGAPRPSGPGGPGGAPGGFPPFGQQPPMDNDQSRKKRNKTRRTVDFPQDGASDFMRRRGMDDDDGSGRSRSRGRKPKKHVVPQSTQPMKAAKRKIRVEEAIRVADLAHQMGIKSGEIIKVLFGLGVMATINNALDIETATVVAADFGYEVEKVGFSEDTFLVPTETDSPEQLSFRPPVVTIMGHVDHGKTSLLDAIRKTSVTSGEAGGITQHIGAYHVKTKRGDIVFLDTPGHEAFTAMRARGAQVTDLVVLVVAADDGVMEQTREAINHSKAAGVPILVAVNKIDKEAANPDRVLRELSEFGLQAESWGGDTVVGFVSAKAGTGLDELLELIALQAEIMELKANSDKPARGHVVEAKLDKGRGPVATVLIQEGTIHQGDAFVCGVFSGRVRALFNDQGRKIKEAGPSMPVEVQGFEGVPEAGEEFICLTDEKAARRIAEARAIKQRERELSKESRVTLETFLARTADTKEAQVLNLVIKADVQGSLEAIIESLRKQSNEKVRIEIIHSGAGAISETDVMLAAASSAIIIGFNVRPTAKVKDVAEQESVDIRFYDIIYKVVDEIKSAMAGMLAPVSREVYLGQAEVRDTFTLPKIGLIAGSFVADGKIVRNAGVRLLRDGVVVYTGKISSLKRFKDDAKEVPKGMECGMGLENFHNIKVGDIIEAFEMVEEAATM